MVEPALKLRARRTSDGTMPFLLRVRLVSGCIVSLYSRRYRPVTGS